MSTNIQFLEQFRKTVEFCPEQLELETDRTQYVVEINKAMYEIMELRDLLYDIIVENCIGEDGRTVNSDVRLYQEAIEYFKELGWIGQDNTMWRDAISADDKCID